MMGPIRTFYTSLYKKINDKDHKFDNGTFLDTMYDDAMQYPMLEMSGQHVEHIPQLCYFYNKQYSNSDNSTPEKKQHKRETYDDILERKTYQRIEKLFDD